MMKKYLFLIILSLLSKLSKSIEESIENNSVSKLISMVRLEIIDQSLKDLPRIKEANILQMVSKMVSVKKEYSLNEAESAYLVFKWIAQNIWIDFNEENLDDPINAYNSGRGSPKALSSLFNNISTFLKVKSDSISGYLKCATYKDYTIQSDQNYTWNYVEINGEYYLLDVSRAISKLKISFNNYLYLYFGTDPEIFIREHFPIESKWQLLSEPYTFEKFESLALLTPFFYLLGFKTISPDTNKIMGKGKIILFSDKSIPELEYSYSCAREYGDEANIDDFNGSPEGKFEIEYNLIKDKCIFYSIELVPDNSHAFTTVVEYSTNYTKDSSLEFNRMALSNSNVEYNN